MTDTIEQTEDMGINLPADYQEQERQFDELLKQAEAEFQAKRRPKYSMPQVLGDYRAIAEKPGLYMRPMCLEVELRALDLYTVYSDGTAVGLARVAVGVAAAVLYRLVLPLEEQEARERIRAYIKGEVLEEEVFVPLTETEVGRMFRDTDELYRLVLDPLDFSLLKKDEKDEAAEKDPNAPDPQTGP
jgi:hypothetical protein